MLARDKDRYLKGLTLFREDGLGDWIEQFAAATAEAAMLAVHYTVRVGELQDRVARAPASTGRTRGLTRPHGR